MESMHRERSLFMSLVNDLCKELSYPERDEEIRDDETLVMEMTLEGIAFTVSHALNTHPEKILIQAVFGPLPNEKKTDVLYRIMHLNRELSETGVATIGYDAATASVVYTHAAVLSELSGATLLTTMTEITWRAEYWQSTYFLQADGPKSTETFNEQFISLA
jgi:hypothetical protein